VAPLSRYVLLLRGELQPPPILGGLGALFLIYAAIRQARTATEVARTGNRQAEIAGRRHVTDTFSKAVEQLGDDKMEVRVGGIYTLERLAREALVSPQTADLTAEEGSGQDLYWAVMETLTAFVRERARWQEPKSGDGGGRGKSDYLWGVDAQSAVAPPTRPTPATDVAAVLAVIRRRAEVGRRREQQHRWFLDLRTTDLRGAILTGAHLEDATLIGAHFEGANLRGAHLERADLEGAYLEGALLEWAHLAPTNLTGAHLEYAVLIDAHLEYATLIRAHLKGAALTGAHFNGAAFAWAHFEGVDLGGADLDGANGLDVAHGDARTRLPEGVARPAHWPPYDPNAEPTTPT
jgi:uncharacterized protein YjbI with pentapeptide repeats